MTRQNLHFNPELIIVDHFDERINAIDIETETLLEDQSLTEEFVFKLNETREKQIEKLEEIKQANLSVLLSKGETVDDVEDEFRQKWSHVIDDPSLEYKHKIDKIKEELIVYDCVLLLNTSKKCGYDLWITSWYHNTPSLQFLK